MVKDEAGFILIGFEFSELEGKNCQLNMGYNGKKQGLNRNFFVPVQLKKFIPVQFRFSFHEK